MPGWIATDKNDCFKVHIADTQQEAEDAADNFAVPYGSATPQDAERYARSYGKDVVNHSQRKVVYRPGFPQTYHGGCALVSLGTVGLIGLVIFCFAMVFTYFVRW